MAQVSSSAVIIIVIVVVGFFSLSFPLVSTVRVSFEIIDINNVLVLNLVPQSQGNYARQPWAQVIGTPLNQPVLAFSSGQQGQFVIYLGITYGNLVLPTALFANLGPGQYQVKVGYIRLFSENPNTPYTCVLTLGLMNGANVTSVTALVYPT